MQDLTLLCINCILQGGHKSHQFCSLNDAVKSEQDLFMSQSIIQNENQNKSSTFLKGLEEYAETLTQIQDKQLKEINRFFIDIKRIVTDREQTLRVKVQDSIQNEFSMVTQANTYLQEIVQNIAIYQQELDNIDIINDEIDFLSESVKRHEILQNLKSHVKFPELKIKILDINKEQETNILIKSLLNIKIVQVKQLKPTQVKKNTFHTNQSCKEFNLFKKSVIKTSEKRQPLGESLSQIIQPSTPIPSKHIVQINLQKKQNDPKQQQKSLRLTNLHEARSILKERSQERQHDTVYSYDQKSITPRKMNRSLSRQTHMVYDISPQIGVAKSHYQIHDRYGDSSQYESFGQYANQSLPYQHEDSIKNEYGTFLNSNMLDDLSSVNRSDISQLYQNMNYIFITLGGFVDHKTQLIEIYDPKKEMSEQYDTMKTNRSKFAALKIQSGNILIMGGKQDGIRVGTCEEYSVKDKRYIESKIRLNNSRSGFGVVQINEFIYAIGGNDGTGSINSVDCYNQQTHKWFKCASMHDKRDELAIVHGSDNHIYAVGGFGGNCTQFVSPIKANTCLTSCERYVISKNYWEPIASMSMARRALAAVSMPDGIYSIGGFNGSIYLSSVERYDDQCDRWIAIVSLNQPRCTLSAVASPDNLFIYVFGGFDNGPLDNVERYSVLNDFWEPCPQMLAKRFMHQTLVLIK